MKLAICSTTWQLVVQFVGACDAVSRASAGRNSSSDTCLASLGILAEAIDGKRLLYECSVREIGAQKLISLRAATPRRVL
jgi:hypothetical protein